jgi:hypothetical protein
VEEVEQLMHKHLASKRRPERAVVEGTAAMFLLLLLLLMMILMMAKLLLPLILLLGKMAVAAKHLSLGRLQNNTPPAHWRSC